MKVKRSTGKKKALITGITGKEFVEKAFKFVSLDWESYVKLDERFPWDAPNYPSEINILTRCLRL